MLLQVVSLSAELELQHAGLRLDQCLAECFDDFSRSRLKNWILEGNVKVDGQVVITPRLKMKGIEVLELEAQVEDEVGYQPEDLPINVVYEDDDIIIVNKPVGLVVHPGAGNQSGTLLNALLYHYPDISVVPRAGIVHRLDKDTSGLMVVAKNIAAHTQLVTQLQAREISREYEAVAIGAMVGGGTVDKPIGRHSTKRVAMAVKEMGKEAVTHYRVIERFREHTHLRLKLETGRTHQIRVHMDYIKHSLVGDQLYGIGLKLPKSATEQLTEQLRGFRRQALHAVQLGLFHPLTGEWMSWQAPLPDDIKALLVALREDTEAFDEFA
ncbi:23S rRNA pseudouridine(1911/1915/1917) synthase RluD [Planctobacterium marinum]|nr:23S rRNA pseudouridine(1911/1915/1917) synthase RluD [Planctobacterium marinum]MCC2605653.1 23S rRNA pseudouridine(1911/1915/1917) synthase RluD [Planctobacterium marinum]